MRAFLPDPVDLRWLVRSLELRSFSAAAREMNVAVSVVSRGIDRLEAGFGISLLRRSTHGLSATPEGAELVQGAREVLGRLDEMAASFDKRRHHVAGAVRLASSQEICEQLIVPQLAALRERHPALRIELVADDRVVDLVTDGIDVALRTTLGNSEAVVARELGSFERRLYASPDYLRRHGSPAEPADLHRHQTVTHTAQGPDVTWAFRQAGRKLDVAVTSQLAASSTALLHRALLAGAGIGMLSQPMAAADERAGALVEVLKPFAPRKPYTLYAVSLPNRRKASRVQAVIAFMQQAARKSWGLAPA
ncbi:MAG: LysR family transcriptional regulator [Hydrogenophaga sp.]|uniref:LysR family transcriptional regulator n=1 Tax=Hydrogenophaga sp. TaxID=1904254 RepID=UPI0016AD3A89|nr:LysR family transcriptional regulator [Hydrogenophaga sp.]NIM41036.1 LysR family transcriptional regulator [Hydrogenophaga sp.]NIN26394.1 LysR family transcriptional regulator [Hydrogenophaga sp.]NIN31269.1 LysR family transcriptional regulator [Hydrogenophaga sp.]NIN55308.1 LysR family transcriptional regulator [Hydrogenophaga sp.]NIO53692.1 LysR family transcriptional regulator [Hydrogenophaga sp.]